MGSHLNAEIVETRSLPTLTHCFPRNFTLITRTASCLRQLPIYVARVPVAPFTRCYPRSFIFYVASPNALFPDSRRVDAPLAQLRTATLRGLTVYPSA